MGEEIEGRNWEEWREMEGPVMVLGKKTSELINKNFKKLM